MRALDLPAIAVGQTFGWWTVVSPGPKATRGPNRRTWTCVCVCGKVGILRGYTLAAGLSQSCKCHMYKHGGAARKPVGDGAYRSWESARARCYSNKHVAYASYGGRGITICPEWKDDFLRFLADMGPCPPGHSLDRIDNDRGYEPGNCRWATPREQMRNTRRSRWVTFNGETLLLIDWAERRGYRLSTLSERLRRGWSVERVLTEPLQQGSTTYWKGKTQTERAEVARRLVAGRQERRKERRMAAATI